MALALSSPSDIVNLTLTRIGFKGDRVGNLYEGSMVAKLCLDIFAQTRDEVLRNGDWGFAERTVNMTLLKTANMGGYFPPNQWDGNVNPRPPFLFEYAYPDDCLKVRSIKSAPLFVMDFDPQPVVFTIENDKYFTPSQKVVLCNVPDAMLIYTASITDPQLWEADFTDAFSAELGLRLAPTLVGMDMAKFEAADAAQSKAKADTTQG